jgi:hypothetical protein
LKRRKDKMLYQQGDIIFRKIEKIPSDAKVVKGRPVIIARGETTGHAHKVVDILDQVKVLVDKEDKEKFYILGPATIEHEEHGTVNLPEGLFVTDRVKEYDHFLEESRQLRD